MHNRYLNFEKDPIVSFSVKYVLEGNRDGTFGHIEVDDRDMTIGVIIYQDIAWLLGDLLQLAA